jgi:hypothetical protein
MAMAGLAASAVANSAYLRPNEDVAASSGWSAVGASNAWETLDDAVIESETPNNGDYISDPTYEGARRVSLQSAGIAGVTSLTSTAWFFTPTTEAVQMIVREGQSPEHAIASGSFSGSGWHSIAVPMANEQSKIDNLQLEFRPVAQHGTPGPHKVSAAFLKLSYTPSSPKLYWGADMDGEVAKMERDSLGNPLPIRTDAPWTKETWDLFEQHAGKPVSIVHFGQPAPWSQNFARTPLELTTARGAIPMISMGSVGATLGELQEGGAKEAALAKWSKEAAEYKQPFFFRWDWEMNLVSAENFPWVAEARHNPAAFVHAWENFHRIADREGATNITWVWCPNVSFLGSTSLKSLYPGNSNVDWTCMDGYNFGTLPDGNGWTSFRNLFSSTYSELTSSEFEGHEKPIMIGETASTESGGSKPEWIAEGLGTSLPTNFPKIKALVWFNWNITENGFEHDWPIESPVTTPSGPSPSTAAFANAISSPYYAANTFGSLTPLTRIQPLP